MSFVSEICAAGLIAGTVPTKGSFVHRARSCDNTSVDAVLQAIATMSGDSVEMSDSMTARTRSTSSPSLQEP